MLRLLEKLRLIKLIWIEDYHQKIYLTVKKKSPFGGYYCYVFPSTKVGHVNLKEDGTCYGESSYIKQWKDYREI